MARVTVEDCLEHVENRFKLVLLAGKRARQLALGTEPLVEWENDKATVVALREIAENLVNEEMMKASLAAPVEEEMEFDPDDFAAALHAEISRELNQTAAQAAGAETVPAQEAAVPPPQLFTQGGPIFAGLSADPPEPVPSSEPGADAPPSDDAADTSQAPPAAPSSKEEQGF